MWIKLISFVVACAWIGSGEHQKRSTILTDESKKILDLFDFSNFDKQEALNYIERNRFDNLIRGKRSKWKLGHLCKSNIQFKDSKKLSEKSNVNNYSRGFDEYPVQVKNEPGLLIREVKHLPLHISKYDMNRRKRHEKLDAGYEKSNETSNVGDETDEREESHEESETANSNGNTKKKRRRHWSKWSEWSACSVTCGKGRKIRFRRCIAKKCPTGELEMGEKACQLPACSLLKKIFNFL